MAKAKAKRRRPGRDYGGLVELVWHYSSRKRDWSGCSCARCGKEIGLEDRAVLLYAPYDKREALLCEDCSRELLGTDWHKPKPKAPE